jgi:endonuclease/exonuclease/phosphatase family metal-dependent hydrolase
MEGIVAKQLRAAAVCLAALAAGWFAWKNFDIKGLDQIKIAPKGQTASHSTSGPVPMARDGDAIRIASFNIQVFGESKLNNPRAMDVLARLTRRFDIVAIQEVRAASQDILPRFVDLVNAEGHQYDYAVGPRLGRSNSKEQYAFVFDTASIEIDRSSIYTVDDPDDLLHREPLVAGFRVRGPPEDQAFTFTLINIHTDPDEAAEEVDALADVFRAVRADGRNEDDVMLLGDLNVADEGLGRLARLPDITWVISGVPTNTRGTAQYDNILFQQSATAEFTGRYGVVDLIREYNLTADQALEVSDHLPIWAEFSLYEGGQPGRLASRTANGGGRTRLLGGETLRKK